MEGRRFSKLLGHVSDPDIVSRLNPGSTVRIGIGQNIVVALIHARLIDGDFAGIVEKGKTCSTHSPGPHHGSPAIAMREVLISSQVTLVRESLPHELIRAEVPTRISSVA